MWQRFHVRLVRLVRRSARARAVGIVGCLVAAAFACSSDQGGHGDPYVPSGWPVAEQSVTSISGFGARSGGRFHQGLDLGAPRNSAVVATADGIVSFAGRSGGSYGTMVVIDHGNSFETCYAHLKKRLVRKGERVQRGERIGTVGKSGNATGYHLHYEVRRSGKPVDPRVLLD